MAVRVIGLNAFLTVVKRASDAGKSPFSGSKNIKPPLEAVQAEEQEAFKSEGTTQGQGWAPLKASTLERRGPGKILQQSGRLRDSLTRQTRDTIIQGKGRRLVIASNVPYAKYHQRGTGRMTARPPMLATKRMARAVAQAVTKRLGNRLRGN